MGYTVEGSPAYGAVNEVPNYMAQSATHDELVLETRARILHVFDIYPFLSKSMINIGIGTGTPGKLWNPVLDSLVEEGIIVVEEITVRTPQGRQQPYSIYHLARNPYNYSPSALQHDSPSSDTATDSNS